MDKIIPKDFVTKLHDETELNFNRAEGLVTFILNYNGDLDLAYTILKEQGLYAFNFYVSGLRIAYYDSITKMEKLEDVSK